MDYIQQRQILVCPQPRKKNTFCLSRPTNFAQTSAPSKMSSPVYTNRKQPFAHVSLRSKGDFAAKYKHFASGYISNLVFTFFSRVHQLYTNVVAWQHLCSSWKMASLQQDCTQLMELHTESSTRAGDTVFTFGTRSSRKVYISCVSKDSIDRVWQ